MTPDQYFKFHADFCAKALDLSMRKNQDYSAPAARTGDKYAVFANFMQAERLNICSVEAGFLVRLSDKISRLANLIRPGHERAVMDEKLADTLMDTVNYCILLAAYLEVKNTPLNNSK